MLGGHKGRREQGYKVQGHKGARGKMGAGVQVHEG